MGSPQKEKSVVLGSPDGHTHLERDQLIFRSARRKGKSEVISSVFFDLVRAAKPDAEIGDCLFGRPSL